MSFPETRRARHVFAFSFNRHPRPAAGDRNRAATEIDEFLFHASICMKIRGIGNRLSSRSERRQNSPDR